MAWIVCWPDGRRSWKTTALAWFCDLNKWKAFTKRNGNVGVVADLNNGKAFARNRHWRCVVLIGRMEGAENNVGGRVGTRFRSLVVRNGWFSIHVLA